ncbi:MAG: Transaldolase [Candidatus Roizmanbacteria bacterium GW2011_GWA2_37_7]|uniref:Transaldolase n=1 Tax=Candidatus Roizmanbacteria bacterium GW2011_GWA2_37_7 TaxID=1618481 RepID=A0A0G0GZN6_9BACT|nr:MAG: Transaldolase [Candidatus Roizmanbacteria bacterium GW2011_GWA2_37_7]
MKDSGSVNMTLVFDQQQAAAVYAATMPTFKPAFISPFVGRWDDRGLKGIDIIKNIVKMYKSFDRKRNEKKSHIEVLSASIRHLTHFYGSIVYGADILTVPINIIEQWVHEDRFMPDESYRPDTKGLRSIVYKELPYHDDYAMYPIEYEKGSLLDEGLVKFANDWNSLIER